MSMWSTEMQTLDRTMDHTAVKEMRPWSTEMRKHDKNVKHWKKMDYRNIIEGWTMDYKTVKKEVRPWSTEGECNEIGDKHEKKCKTRKTMDYRNVAKDRTLDHSFVKDGEYQLMQSSKKNETENCREKGETTNYRM